MRHKLVVIRDIEEDQKELQKLNSFIISILVILVAILPLITRTATVDFVSPLMTDSSILETGIKGDVFTYYKFWFLITVSFIVVCLFLYSIFATGYVLTMNYTNVLIMALSLTILISVLFAPYQIVALTGFYNRHDGTITYLCYLLLFFISANITFTTKQIRYFIYALFPVLSVNVLLGMFGFFGYELIEQGWVKTLLFPKELIENIQEGSRFITTINHGNYVSGFAAMLIGIFFTLAILSKENKYIIIYSIASIISFTLLFTTLARSGFVAFVLTLPVLLYFIIKSKQRKKSLIVFISILVASSIIFFPMAKHNPEVWDRTLGFFINSNPFQPKEILHSKNSFSDVTDVISALSENIFPINQVVASSVVEESYLPEIPERGVGSGSGRVYIWEKTLELIKERPLLGYGLDTLPFFFPQDDPEIYANIESYNLVVDKPHNMYLGILYGSGIFAFLIFLGLLVIHFYKNVTLFVNKNICNNKIIYLAALFTGWWAYLVQGVFNDTIIGTTSVFFIIFGVSVATMKNINVEKNK